MAFISNIQQQNILTRLTPPSSILARPSLLTLHLLFPHDLLPALDLLDRGLVTRLTCPSNVSEGEHKFSSGGREVWYVQSASAITDAEQSRVGVAGGTGRFRNALRSKATDTFYEVRLDSWNCSCAGFAFQAFILLTTGEEVWKADVGSGGLGKDDVAMAEGSREGSAAEDFRFGGTAMNGGMAPVCKHILAAALARNMPAFVLSPDREGRDRERQAGRQELAGWGAGWGDRF
ncbi:uncharacterized protein HMPREF1541_10808 [Cyphellophora europaea CBS 101466]|uniref:SWIM-type domain-containing protein n=1 Tax=Cyphellophora europaea (strain CBS 101466) TaxID=1220924 RepID=W2S6D9_CYPE1|nr:uncharacterized protein HMPREF1541_10808 [Cyphellophora europaea CBS 101466]ETN44257.1 hypothetical protein HMPREF1541_10808 [Cyphellophora europaea CBS 101466]